MDAVSQSETGLWRLRSVSVQQHKEGRSRFTRAGEGYQRVMFPGPSPHAFRNSDTPHLSSLNNNCPDNRGSQWLGTLEHGGSRPDYGISDWSRSQSSCSVVRQAVWVLPAMLKAPETPRAPVTPVLTTRGPAGEVPAAGVRAAGVPAEVRAGEAGRPRDRMKRRPAHGTRRFREGRPSGP